MKYRHYLIVGLFFTALLYAKVLTEEAEDEAVDTFSEIDVKKVDNDPVRFGVKFWDWEPHRYKKILKALGPVFNTGNWPTFWEVSQSAPAPWEATDERMDLWVETIYRNLHPKKYAMLNTTYLFGNYSVDVIGIFLGVPEAYSLSLEQKQYRAKKKAEEEGKEADLSDFYYNHHGLDFARIDDLGKFYAASVDHVRKFGCVIPYVELMENVALADKDNLYVAPEEVTYLIKKAREEMNARDITADDVKIMAPGTQRSAHLTPYLEALAKDKEAYDKLFAITTRFIDEGNSLTELQSRAEKLQENIKKILPGNWERKPVVVSGFNYYGPDELEYDGMRFYGNIEKCYDDKYQRTGHMVLKDSFCQSPWYAVRMLAGLSILMSHGFPWVVYNQGADQWWHRSCDGLIDRDQRPKQVMAAFESLLPYLTNETYPITKQWKNVEDCYISAFKSVQAKMRIVVAVTNFSPKVCERSFSLKGVDLWDIQKGRIVTYNNGTVSINADKPYRALLTHKTLNYDVYDVEDGSNAPPDIEFDLTVGPYASATAIIDARAPKGKKKNKKPKKDETAKSDGSTDANTEEIAIDVNDVDTNENPEHSEL